MRQRSNFADLGLISVVIPAYKQAKTIVRDITRVQKALDTLTHNYEIIVVVDGMIDDTYKKALRKKSSRTRILGYEKNHGKGQAVQFGMLQAKGDVIGFIDAGMDIHPQGFSMLLSHMQWYNADVIVGSKLHPVSKVNYPLGRKILSRGYRLLTRVLFGFKVRDTQVGMKFFRRKVVRDVVPRLLVKRFAFDIELLAVSYQLGYTRIYEAPVEINFIGASTITTTSFWKIISLMLWDTLAVFYRVKLLHYYTKQNSARKSKKLLLRPIYSS